MAYRPERRPSLAERVRRAVRRRRKPHGEASMRLTVAPEQDDEGGIGTREPRRPRPPALTGGAVLPLPHEPESPDLL